MSERDLARADYRAANAWEFSSCETIKRAVKDRLGVSFISRNLVSQEIERKELVTFRVSGVDQMLRPIHLLQYSAKDLTPEGSAFVALLAKDASTPAAEWRPAVPCSISLPTASDFGVGS